MPDCQFCRIVADEPDAHVLATDAAVGFLDHRPLFPGHLLVVPRTHWVTLDVVPPDALAPLLEAVQTTMRALTRATDCEGHFVASNNVVSQSVPHLHWHVVPRVKGDGLRGFFWPRSRYEDGELAEWRDRVRTAVDAVS
jgi:histidine triad (HIT) family protein